MTGSSQTVSIFRIVVRYFHNSSLFQSPFQHFDFTFYWFYFGRYISLSILTFVISSLEILAFSVPTSAGLVTSVPFATLSC